MKSVIENLGKVVPTFEGAFDNTKAYDRLSCVFDGKTGSTYIGDTPCKWCEKNPCNPARCTTTTIIKNDKLTASNNLDDKKGEINSEK